MLQKYHSLVTADLSARMTEGASWRAVYMSHGHVLDDVLFARHERRSILGDRFDQFVLGQQLNTSLLSAT